jgi:hypothetical protein
VVSAYARAGYGETLPVKGTTGLIYYNDGNAWVHVERYEYDGGEKVKVWNTSGQLEPGVPFEKKYSLTDLREAYYPNRYVWERYIIVPTDWLWIKKKR